MVSGCEIGRLSVEMISLPPLLYGIAIQTFLTRFLLLAEDGHSKHHFSFHFSWCPAQGQVLAC